jgi:hypothetical protein
MKKKLVFGIVSLVLALIIIFPAQITAHGKPTNHANHFTANARIAIVNQGILSEPVPIDDITVSQHQEGEVVIGLITRSPQWPNIAGAAITIVHNADSVIDFQSETFTATATGNIVLKRGLSQLSGTYNSIINGTFIVNSDGSITFTSAQDEATWVLIDANGNTIADGTASATLTPIMFRGQATLGGSMVMSGNYY